MKQLLMILTLILTTQIHIHAQNHPAYFETGKSTESMESAIQSVRDALQSSGFRIIGQYNPGDNDDLSVVCYTNSELEKIALDFPDRGALAAALKVGLKKEGDAIKISMINPIYLFYAYFVKGVDKHEKALSEISAKAISAMQVTSSEMVPFGGALEKKKLQKYHYKVMMPYFKNAEKLRKFSSFEEGLTTIQKNLESGKGDTEKVYELIYNENEVAVFGVGLKNSATGESKFLPIIGDDHVAAMPYELILQGNQATILPGRYRIALHWPELTMGTFMKIMSTPGDIKKTMEGLTQ